MKKYYTLPTKIERDAYMAGQNWGMKKSIREFKKAIEISLWGFPSKYLKDKNLLRAYSEGKDEVAKELINYLNSKN